VANRMAPVSVTLNDLEGLTWKAMGKMRNCGMHKVKCGMKNAERRRLVNKSDHVTADIPQFTTRHAWTA